MNHPLPKRVPLGPYQEYDTKNGELYEWENDGEGGNGTWHIKYHKAQEALPKSPYRVWLNFSKTKTLQ